MRTILVNCVLIVLFVTSAVISKPVDNDSHSSEESKEVVTVESVPVAKDESKESSEEISSNSESTLTSDPIATELSVLKSDDIMKKSEEHDAVASELVQEILESDSTTNSQSIVADAVKTVSELQNDEMVDVNQAHLENMKSLISDDHANETPEEHKLHSDTDVLKLKDSEAQASEIVEESKILADSTSVEPESSTKLYANNDSIDTISKLSDNVNDESSATESDESTLTTVA